MGVEVLASQERFQGGTVLVLFWFVFGEGQFYLVVQADLHFWLSPCLRLSSTRITDMPRHAQIFFFFLFGFPLYCLIIKHLSLARKVTPPLSRSWQRLSVRNHTGDASNTLTLPLLLLGIKTKVKTSYLEKELLKAVDSSPVVPLKEPKKRDAVLAVLG